MPKFLGKTIKLSGGICVPGVVECSFPLKITSIAECYGLMRFLS